MLCYGNTVSKWSVTSMSFIEYLTMSRRHKCRYTYHGFNFTCHDGWHFFYWALESDVEKILQAQCATEVLIRFGEPYTPSALPHEVAVWLHESVTYKDLERFWAVYYSSVTE